MWVSFNNPAVLNWNKSIWDFLNPAPDVVLNQSNPTPVELSLLIFYTYIQGYYFYKYFMFVLLLVDGNTVSLCCRGLCEWMIYPKTQTHGSVMCVSVDGLLLFSSYYLSMDVSTLSSAAWMLHGSGSEHHKATQRSNSPRAIHCVLGASLVVCLSLSRWL